MSAPSVVQDHLSMPYVGNRPFDTADARLFFGRERETAELVDLWRAHRLTILHGDAGVGKTSLLQAGAIPRLRAAFAHVLPVGRMSHRPSFPMAALPEQNPFTFALTSSWCPDESPTRISERLVAGVLRMGARTDRFGDPLETLAVIDQAELLFRREDAAHALQRARFLEQLVEALAAQPALRLLIAVRSDHLDETLTLARALGPGACADYALGLLDRRSAVVAVKRPLDGIGRPVDERFVRHLVDELRTVRAPGQYGAELTSGISPALLQAVCARLWTDLPTEPDPDPDPRRLAADVDRALIDFCAQTLATVAADHRMTPLELGTWFRSAFDHPRGEDTLPEGPPSTVLHALQDHHLLQTRIRSGERRYALPHPRLLQPVGRLGDRPGSVRRPDAPTRLKAAEHALSVGDFDLARRHVEGAIRGCGQHETRFRAAARSFLGNIAYEEGDTAAAGEHYRAATAIFEALHDTCAVGRLLTALGRLKLAEGRVGEAVEELRAAADRIPNDVVVQTCLGQALWRIGRRQAALAALDTALTLDGGNPDARRIRTAILADPA